jgi:hypothetical protein
LEYLGELNAQFNCDTITKNEWGIQYHSNDDSVTVNFLKMDYVNFLIDEKNKKIENNTKICNAK